MKDKLELLMLSLAASFYIVCLLYVAWVIWVGRIGLPFPDIYP